ncbi:MAG: hypothetical protein ACTTJ2_06610 [Anaerovoracaceae bacterium]
MKTYVSCRGCVGILTECAYTAKQGGTASVVRSYTRPCRIERFGEDGYFFTATLKSVIRYEEITIASSYDDCDFSITVLLKSAMERGMVNGRGRIR